jgi:hypothetical protein
MTHPARLQAPWKRCGQCGAVHAQSYCRWCEETTPTIPMLVDDDLEAAFREDAAAGVVSSPLRKRGSTARPG